MIKNILVGAWAIVCAIYLVNPGAGVIELIPDNVPFVGNLDEAAATAFLIYALRYFGANILEGRPKKTQ
ncbi:MAG: DUF1232 domain-containing protein [Leptospiraceae bacterium]|nr:DUF1232 domain-containing protein [Leptospiraceae bacterium]MCB1200299.1 DUF1232 domain-containing protein [Leptospiraceae bacterium]